MKGKLAGLERWLSWVTRGTRRSTQSRPFATSLLVLTSLFGLTFAGCGGSPEAALPAIPAVQADEFPASAHAEAAKVLSSLQADPMDASANGRLGMLL